MANFFLRSGYEFGDLELVELSQTDPYSSLDFRRKDPATVSAAIFFFHIFLCIYSETYHTPVCILLRHHPVFYAGTLNNKHVICSVF